jgi:DNA-directed RNA polymerase subunit RPC12/RpoP
MTDPENKANVLAKVETSVCGLVLHNLEDMTTVAQVILQSGLAPDSFKTKEQIFVGLQAGAEMGLKPMQSLNSIVVIHGKPTLWGDAALALVKRSGLLLFYAEEVTGEGDGMIAHVRSVRNEGNDCQCEVKTSFTVADAITAGLWRKKGPWTTHPKRMLKYKARAFNLRDNFPDVLFGMHMTEEMQGEEPLPAPESDVSPRAERRMAVPITAVDTTRKPVSEVAETELMPDSEVVAGERNQEQPHDGADTTWNEKICSELVTFVCKECGQTFQYGKEEGKGVRCECGKGLLVEQVKLNGVPLVYETPMAEEEKAEPSKEEKIASLYKEVNGMYVAQEGKDFIEFAAYVLCLDDSEIVPQELTDEQLKQIKAYIETNGVAIN